MTSKPSGAYFRKKRKLQEENAEKHKKISTFFAKVTKVTADDDVVNTINNESESNKNESVLNLNNGVTKIVSCMESVQQLANEVDPYTCPINDEDSNDLISSLKQNKNPTDKANFNNRILSANLKKFIIENGPCRPKMIFPKDDKKRRFSASFYTRISYTGQVTNLFWLCYSAIENKAYCEPCWLFGNNQQLHNIVNGTNDWKNLHQTITRHMQSHLHINCCIIYNNWKVGQSIIFNKNLERKLLNEKKFWTDVLERLFSITLRLTKCSLPFRGHREHIFEIYNGNFLSEVELLAKYDPVMKELLQKPKGHIKYLSPKIQNELIYCLGHNLENNIIKRVRACPFYTIIMDTTQDITKVDQLSIIIRFVDIEKDTLGNTIKFNICESFMGFMNVTDRSAGGLTNEILNFITKFDLDIHKCRGQGYDGASVMSGIYAGVQKRIKDIERTAEFIHCAVHNTGLVINDAVCGVKEVSTFFTVLQDLFNFFGVSLNRWELLASFTSESNKTIKKLNPTRWAGRARSLTAVTIRYKDILMALTKISLTFKNRKDRDEANRLLKSMANFDFVFLCTILSKIFTLIDTISKLLQYKELDLITARNNLQNVLHRINHFRQSYIEIKLEAIEIASKWGIDPYFKNVRHRKIKKFHDELSEDYRLTNSEENFKINTYYRVLDIISTQIKHRFQSMNHIIDKFDFLQPQNIIAKAEAEIKNCAKLLRNHYPNDLTSAFEIEIILFKRSFGSQNQLSEIKSIKDLYIFLQITNSYMALSFSEVSTALQLFLTLPVTVASAERSFSKLKIIKNYLRNSIGQDRLKYMALLSIEAEEAKKMEMTQLIKDFVSAKTRKKYFGNI